MSYHLLPVRMSIIKRSTINKCCREYGEKGTLPHWWECELVKLLWETVWRFLKKLKIELQSDPETLFLGIYLEKTNLKRYMCSYVHRLLIFLLPVLIPACDSSSLAFCMMCSAYKLNKQHNNLSVRAPYFEKWSFEFYVFYTLCLFALIIYWRSVLEM